MFYLIELQKPKCAPGYVITQADTPDDARALIDARLGRDDAYEDVEILGVHPIH